MKKNIDRYMRLKEKPNEYNAEIENTKIDELTDAINKAVVDILSTNSSAKLSVSIINEFLGRTKLKESNLVNDLGTYIDQKWEEKIKQDESLAETFSSGLKDYRSLQNCLLDYEFDEKCTWTIPALMMILLRTLLTIYLRKDRRLTKRPNINIRQREI